MKLKRIIAILAIAAMMATMLFGCGNADNGKTTAGSDDKTTAGAGGDQTTEETPTDAPAVYPLEGNPAVTIWTTISTAVTKSYETLEDRPYTKELEKLTGIDVQYVVPSSTDNATIEKDLMITERKFTDIIGFKGTEVEQMHADDVIIPLNDIIDQYMPNYKAYLEANPEIEKLIRSDDGNIYFVPLVMEDPSMGNTYGFYCRQDWLDELGIKTPETIDEWYDALVKIRDAKGVAPIIATINNLLTYGAFLNAYVPDRSGGNYYVEDGKVFYSPATDGMKEYLQVLKKWYAEGLIHADAGGSISSSVVRSSIATGQAFGSVGYAGSGIQRVTTEAITGGYTIELTAVATALAKAGETAKYQSATPQFANSTGGSCISSQCENVEAAARLLDFYWSEEGYLLNNFGIEGTTYTVVDGVETYTDYILKNPDGLAVNEAMAGYMVNFEGGTGVQALNYLTGYYSATPAAAEAPAIWSSKGEIDNSMRLVSHTVEEQDTLDLYSELTTYTKECLTKFVLGTMDIDTQWDEFLTKLNEFGLEECLKVKQAAYDRLMAK